MEIITTKSAMQQRSSQLKRSGKSIGFVPTMGYLHNGHLKLVHHAKQDNEITVMSIFVNPLQFGAGEDFDTYPRDHERDKRLAEKNGVDILFLPDREEMYQSELSLDLKVVKRANILCGRSRPGHFDGVATVLVKLFNIILPDSVYFGMKDAQQVAVVDSLISHFDFPITLVPVETDREEDGLARSSRNVYLSKEEREQAPAIFKAIKTGELAIVEGEQNPSSVVKLVEEYINKNTDGVIDYVEVLSFPELTPLNRLQGKIIIAAAVKFSKARLIDNIIIDQILGRP
ncbi:pantoate--beta-alanine ligase [Lederbergia citrea]|uniref:Pantothenate synthetase n=1 Tax=Lederbergia citrea TaxID=2833581 RepID=A0A942Z4A2_9BACI|nr:pantoate--beta-alanine ligase [Lederbergia citrea]MBS4176587.1 pantoate--beta-alanine ligase [Lederbergia citrea]MBS4222180.1 pantoate--beta-alanine ligase [Lederbergia citrea]